uniref:G domain-containing protein n=1 Tax=Acrobeloides nanus TaxID=290746 RepID=A0A914DXV3_9BILA
MSKIVVRFLVGNRDKNVLITTNDPINVEQLVEIALKKGGFEQSKHETLRIRVYEKDVEEFIDIDPPYNETQAENLHKYEVSIRELGEQVPSEESHSATPNYNSNTTVLYPKLQDVTETLTNKAPIVETPIVPVKISTENALNNKIRILHEGETITRRALGRIAAIGELYDARTDNFCGRLLFAGKIPGNAVQKTDNHNTDCNFLVQDSLNEKFDKLEVEGELKVSFLAGAIEVSGHGRYLSTNKKSEREASVTLVCKTTTQHEFLNVDDPSVTPLFSTDAIKGAKNATHVVVGIQWGALATATLSYQNKENQDKRDISGKLEFQFFADALITRQKVPNTVEEAIDFARDLPSAIQKTNDGKGVPISYTLLPLSALQSYLTATETIDHLLCKVDEITISVISRMFDDMERNRRLVYDIQVDFEDNSYCLPNTQIDTIRNKLIAIENCMASIRQKVRDEIVNVRSGKQNISVLNSIVEEYDNSDCSRNNVQNFLDGLHDIKHKISFVKNLQQRKVGYVTKGCLLDNERANLPTNQCYIYFCEWKLNDERFAENTNLFKSLVEDGLHKCIFVDLQVSPKHAKQEGVPEGNRICQYSNGGYISYDVVADSKKEMQLCLAKCAIPIQTRNYTDPRPNKRIDLELRCPNNLCSQEVHEWLCYDCRKFFTTLKEAKASRQVYLIPAQFTITDKDLKQKVIKIGDSKNENLAVGKSSTQHPKAHVFRAGKKTIRLIDTPGIGDSRGLEQDKENFAEILSYIAKLDEIHGICILLKPNNSVMTIAFSSVTYVTLMTSLCVNVISTVLEIVFEGLTCFKLFYLPKNFTTLKKNKHEIRLFVHALIMFLFHFFLTVQYVFSIYVLPYTSNMVIKATIDIIADVARTLYTLINSLLLFLLSDSIRRDYLRFYGINIGQTPVTPITTQTNSAVRNLGKRQ